MFFLTTVMWKFDKLPRSFYTYLIFTATIIIWIIFIVYDSQNNERQENESEVNMDYIRYLHHVSIKLDGKYRCSGSLIGKKHVLTAAHCVRNYVGLEPQAEVVVGAIQLPGGRVHSIKTITLHPSYDHKTQKDDIAILKLQQEVGANKYEIVTIIPLPNPKPEWYVGRKLNLTSFLHRRGFRDAATINLRAVGSSVVDNDTCQEQFENRNLIGKFCAVVVPEDDYCQSDSGSPVTVNNDYLIGIWSDYQYFGCADKIPELFTYVPHYLEFINLEMNKKN